MAVNPGQSYRKASSRMPKVASEKRSEKNGWGNGQLFGSETNENTFQGAGFKDKEKALETIRLLEGRDITYQYQIINSMYNRAKVILRRTTDKDKRNNLTEAIDTFEAWIDDYKSNSRSKENFSYLSLDLVEGYEPLAKHHGLETDFLTIYKEVDGDLKALRSKKVTEKDITWDVERNRRLKEIAPELKENGVSLYESEGDFRGLPTLSHTKAIILGYSPDQSKLKKCLSLVKEKLSA
ncbi:unnamed protein product [Nezara viridula]|uniref:Uncharacterized protein n=1 Tax=Nezara viridula TaxID=85310 RepID=A0A9P0MTN2_NEZVI|nr:unnamed protein product [Nezara viridula]